MPQPARLIRFWPLALAMLGGCQTPPPPAPEAPAPALAVAPAVPASAAPARPTLIEEQRRLSALFQGTPVVFTPLSSTSLQVDVPLKYSFDPAQAVLRPSLTAVVDRIGQSQRDAPSRILVSAAADAPPKARAAAPAASSATRTATAARVALAARRATGIRDRLVAQGIAADRIGLIDSDSPGIRLLIKAPPAP